MGRFTGERLLRERLRVYRKVVELPGGTRHEYQSNRPE